MPTSRRFAVFSSLAVACIIFGYPISGTAQSLDNVNQRVINEARLTAQIIGFDRNEIERLKADVRQLQTENAQLRSVNSASPVSSSLESRVAALEFAMAGLHSTLQALVHMLTTLLVKLN